MAEARGAIVAGTLGVLIVLVETGRLSLAEADDLLDAMIVHGYRSPVRSLHNLLADHDV